MNYAKRELPHNLVEQEQLQVQAMFVSRCKEGKSIITVSWNQTGRVIVLQSKVFEVKITILFVYLGSNFFGEAGNSLATSNERWDHLGSEVYIVAVLASKFITPT